MREFARREGCSHTLVQKAVAAGHLAKNEGGKLDATLLGTPWRVAARQADEPPPTIAVPNAEALADVVRRLVADAGEMPTRAESERAKEYYLAALRRLEFELKSGAVIARAAVETAVDQAMLTFRSGLESIAGRLSAELAGITDPAIIKARLTHEHHRVLLGCADRLEQLAGDLPPDGQDAAAATPAHGGPMGERGARAAGRKRRTRAVPK